MVRSTIAGLRIPSVRKDLESSAASSSPAVADDARSVSLPNPAGRTTLQVNGVHLRLVPTKDNKKDVEYVPLAVNAIIRAHVRGELSQEPRSFIVGAAALQFGEQQQQQEEEQKSAHYDKRVINAKAREERAAAMPKAVAPASVFIPLDIRLQMEKVKLTVELMASPTRFRKRARGQAEELAQRDCSLDVTVVGTVSLLA